MSKERLTSTKSIKKGAVATLTIGTTFKLSSYPVNQLFNKGGKLL